MGDSGQAVFLSYAREDTDAARRIADALRAFGVEVWFDQHELRGGDAWDAKIRKQIKDCALFVPIVSAQTQARGEGYFRREWKLAIDRTHDMAAAVAFLVPVVIDETREADAIVPDEFMRVQWTRLPHGVPSPQFVEQINRLLQAGTAVPPVGHDHRRGARATGRSGQQARQARSLAQGAGSGEGAARDGRRRAGASTWAVPAAALLAIGVVAVLFTRKSQPPVGTAALQSAAPARSALSDAPAAPVLPDKSIAVLAFADLSEARNSEHLSDGISEELLDALAKIPGLRVSARTSAFSFKGRNVPIPEIAATLNVGFVVEGSVQRAGDRVKISAQLINAADGYQIWGDKFTRDLKDLFAVQEEIAALVAKNLSLKLGMANVATPASAPTRNPAAYEAYLRGRVAEGRSRGEQSVQAVRHYEEALRLDPGYALAWARLAGVCTRIVSGAFDRSNEMVTKARAALAAAERLDPNLPEVSLARARIRLSLDRDPDAAWHALALVERARPGDAEVQAIRAEIGYSRGEWDDRLVRAVTRAVDADPQNGTTLLNAAVLLSAIGRFAAADELCDRAAAVGADPEGLIRQKVVTLLAWTNDTAAALALLESMPHATRSQTRYHYQRAGLLESRSDLSGAIAEYERYRAAVAENFPNRSGPRNLAVTALYHMARIEVRRGRADAAAQLFAQAERENERTMREFPAVISGPRATRALLQARRGETEAALATVEELLADVRRDRSVPSVGFARRTKATVLTIGGRIDEAVAELRAVHEMGYGFGYELRANPEWEPLHSHAGFRKLAAEAEARANAEPRRKT